jgi:hypothetical protein
LDPSTPSSRSGLELAFIERQGVAAWMERALDGAAASAVLADPQIREPGQAESPRRDLILVLMDLVMGDRQEEHDG